MSKSMTLNALPVLSTAGSLDAYIQQVNAIPMLSQEEEQELARRYREQNDLEAARRMVLAHLRFVVHVARSYAGYGLPLADLIQEGNIGLMKAVKRFDPAQGVRLVSFAVHWIRAEMHEFILKNWRIVKVATTKAQRKLFFNLRKSRKRLGWMNQKEVDAIAEDLGVSSREVMEMESRMSGQDIGFDAPAADDDEGSRAAPAPTLYLTDERGDPSSVLEAEDWEEHNHQLLFSGLEQLDTRSQDIIRRRWLQEDKATLQELADEYGVSAERIRQIENQAMKKLRASMAA